MPNYCPGCKQFPKHSAKGAALCSNPECRVVKYQTKDVVKVPNSPQGDTDE